MPISVVEDIKSVSELKKKTNEIFKQLHQTGRPIVVTVNGKPNAVLMDVEIFEKKLKALNLSALLVEAEDDLRNGKTRPARDFLNGLSDGKKVQR
jgi:prevent-host-death family protein